MRPLFLISVLILTAFAIRAQEASIKFGVGPQLRFAAGKLSWDGPFGGLKNEPNNVYSLMTQGGFLAPTSPDYAKLIVEWLEKHTNADAVVVYDLQPMMRDVPDSKMRSLWIVDGDESLNIYLVRNGSCPAGTMVLNAGDKTPLRKDEYEAFEEAVWEAQKMAKLEKLGIWADKKAAN